MLTAGLLGTRVVPCALLWCLNDFTVFGDNATVPYSVPFPLFPAHALLFDCGAEFFPVCGAEATVVPYLILLAAGLLNPGGNTQSAPVAQQDRALISYIRCRAFESPQGHKTH